MVTAAHYRLPLIAGLGLLSAGNSTVASDMPAMGGSFLGSILVMLIFGLPFTLVLFPALAIAPAFLIRTIAVGPRTRGNLEEAAYLGRSRKWRIWTLASLIPWGFMGLLLLYELARKSF